MLSCSESDVRYRCVQLQPLPARARAHTAHAQPLRRCERSTSQQKLATNILLQEAVPARGLLHTRDRAMPADCSSVRAVSNATLLILAGLASGQLGASTSFTSTLKREVPITLTDCGVQRAGRAVTRRRVHCDCLAPPRARRTRRAPRVERRPDDARGCDARLHGASSDMYAGLYVLGFV